VTTELAVITPAFLDLTFVGLEALPGPGQERYAGDLLRSPGGGAITAVAAARLGLETTLVAPLGTDLAGDFVKRAVEEEGVAVSGFRPDRTPQTVVMPVDGDRAMVTIDSGVRARAADVAALSPVAAAAGLEQMPLIPEGSRAYITCGDDDARAASGRLPAGLENVRALFLSVKDALVLTGTSTADDAAGRLAEAVQTVVLTLEVPDVLALIDGRRAELPELADGPVVDPTGDRDLLCAAFAWAELRGADVEDAVRWAHLYSRLAMNVPTATGGAVALDRLLEAGDELGLTRPSGVRA
jgi:sugar/nucleoside kinase (ribokinase family)